MAVYDEKARRGRTASKISTTSLNRRLPAICLIRLPVAIVFPLNEEIRKTELNGAAGKVKFDARGDNAGGATPVTLFVIKDGKYVEQK